MFHGLIHQGRLNSISAEYQPHISQRENECAGLIFLNRYFMGVLAKLEPNHPLLDVGLREKIGRWGGFSFQETEGDRLTRLQAAVEAGSSFSMPSFETVAQGKTRMQRDGNRLAELWDQHNLAMKQWKEDQARGISYARPENPVVLYGREMRGEAMPAAMKE